MCNKGQNLINILLYFCIIKVAVTANLKQIFVDIGKNITIPCPLHTKDVMWVREGRREDEMFILNNGSLFIENARKNDSGIYICSRQNVALEEKVKFNVTVKTPPPPLQNVVVRTSSIIALILWEVNGTGGYPIINFTAQYRLADGLNGSWLPISPNHITPNSRQVDVYKLKPNTTYEFRIWATNQLGKGAITEVTGTTSHEYKEEEIARRMLAGADKFDTRIWTVAVGIVMGTLILLGLGTCFLLYQECHIPTVVAEEQEIIELVPNIILNPGFDGNIPNNNERPADENFNNEMPLRLNNNTVIQPRNHIM